MEQDLDTLSLLLVRDVKGGSFLVPLYATHDYLSNKPPSNGSAVIRTIAQEANKKCLLVLVFGKKSYNFFYKWNSKNPVNNITYFKM